MTLLTQLIPKIYFCSVNNPTWQPQLRESKIMSGKFPRYMKGKLKPYRVINLLICLYDTIVYAAKQSFTLGEIVVGETVAHDVFHFHQEKKEQFWKCKNDYRQTETTSIHMRYFIIERIKMAFCRYNVNARDKSFKICLI